MARILDPTDDTPLAPTRPRRPPHLGAAARRPPRRTPRREPRFDRVARLGWAALEVPLVYVALDGPRQVILGACGVGAEYFDGLPRAQTLCRHTIDGGRPLLVPDASADERFATLPAVRGGPRVRFYLGHPLRDRAGNVIGTLCLIDDKVRTSGSFVHLDLAEVIENLARLAERELEISGLLDARESERAARGRLARQAGEVREYARTLQPPPTHVGPAGLTFDGSGGDDPALYGYAPTSRHDPAGSWTAFVVGSGRLVGAGRDDMARDQVGGWLHAARLRHALADLLIGDSPAAAICQLAGAFPPADHAGRTVEAAAVRYDPAGGGLAYACAGDATLLLVDDDGRRARRLRGEGWRRVRPGDQLWLVNAADPASPDVVHELAGAVVAAGRDPRGAAGRLRTLAGAAHAGRTFLGMTVERTG